jgi:hypothetical protein
MIVLGFHTPLAVPTSREEEGAALALREQAVAGAERELAVRERELALREREMRSSWYL